MVRGEDGEGALRRKWALRLLLTTHYPTISHHPTIPLSQQLPRLLQHVQPMVQAVLLQQFLVVAYLYDPALV